MGTYMFFFATASRPENLMILRELTIDLNQIALLMPWAITTSYIEIFRVACSLVKFTITAHSGSGIVKLIRLKNAGYTLSRNINAKWLKTAANFPP